MALQAHDPASGRNPMRLLMVTVSSDGEEPTEAAEMHSALSLGDQELVLRLAKEAIWREELDLARRRRLLKATIGTGPAAGSNVGLPDWGQGR